MSFCGSKLPAELEQKLIACEDDVEAMRKVGVEHAIHQCRDLIDHKVPGIHFYCLNKADTVLKITDACKDLL